MSRFILLASLSLALAFGSGFGCYTMLRHPGFSDDAASASYDASEGKTCQDCHSDVDSYHWSDPYYQQFYNSAPDTWGAYYAHPWWYNEFWYRVPRQDSAPDVQNGTRHAWLRGAAPAPVPPIGGSAAPSQGSQGSVVSQPSQSNDSGQSDANGSSQPDNSQSSAPPAQKEPDKDQDQQRHAWGR